MGVWSHEKRRRGSDVQDHIGEGAAKLSMKHWSHAGKVGKEGKYG